MENIPDAVLAAKEDATIIMLDNFTPSQINQKQLQFLKIKNYETRFCLRHQN